MRSRRLFLPLLIIAAVLGAAGAAHAGNYIVYLHGRMMPGWPSNALLGAPSGWSHVTLGYDGSAALGNSSVRAEITDAIATRCGSGNQCVVVCYSAGCARMLDAYSLLKDQGRYPPNILWSEAAASAAGGSELAVIATKWLIKLIAKVFKMDAAIDEDLKPNVLRAGAYAHIQNQATSPVYHLAGTHSICIRFSIVFAKVKLCTNDFFPGGAGDGIVPVHSAGGYADNGTHRNTNDGSAKYIFRAYEQTPLYDADHSSILGPLVSAGSLRLAINKAGSCPGMPAVNPAMPDASIVFEDADGAYVEEVSPLAKLVLCGNDMWTGDPPPYGTCFSTAGCCTDFSTGSAGGCSCGERLCRQPRAANVSFYTGNNCTGTEYSYNAFSFDGLGMTGETESRVLVQSARSVSDGRCQTLVRQVTHWGACPVDFPISWTFSNAHRVYRPATAPPPPAGSGDSYIIETMDSKSFCDI